MVGGFGGLKIGDFLERGNCVFFQEHVNSGFE
jgi:hypothetical protein